MDEIILVDLSDNEIGTGEKLDVHVNNRLHRAFSVFIVNDNKMLIQKRALEKYHSGGLWANACCSHPRKGEKLDEAVTRRLREELGIKCDTKKVFSFIYYEHYSNLSEYEYDHVFLGQYAGEIEINKNEIEEYKWIDISKLEEWLLNNPEDFAAWFLISCPKIINIWKDEKSKLIKQ